jgi:vacuolar-type H+-ATPase subunit I/STV1
MVESDNKCHRCGMYVMSGDECEDRRRIAELEAENTRLRQAISNWKTDVEEHRRVQELKTQLAEAQRDVGRVKWAEENSAQWDGAQLWSGGDLCTGVHSTLREAIDAAMREG